MYVRNMISLAGLNPEQRQAAETIEGPVLILAGAGSGKTRTLTYRIAHMIDNLEINPKEILGVSFTNKAAKEMRERVIGLLGKRKSRGISLATFHSLGVKILRQEIHHLGYEKNFTIYDSSDQLGIIRDGLRNYKADKKFDPKIIHSRIGYLKNRGIGPQEFTEGPLLDPESPNDAASEFIYHFYQDKLRFFNAIDFDDILFLMVKLFKQFPEIARKYSEKFRYIMIDEYQDTNGLQFDLVTSLTSTHENLCVVGDDDQSIYSFRGADISNILNFEKQFPNAKVVKLEQNYRSGQEILDLANEVIKLNTNRREKKLWSQKTANKPILWSTADSDHEAQIVVEDIVQHQSSGGHLGDIAILYRNKSQTQIFEDELRMSQVPYTVLGGQKFYEKKEVKDLIAYMCVILNPKDEMSLRRILNVPNRGIGTATLEKYLKNAAETKTHLYAAMKDRPDVDPKRQAHISEFTRLIDHYHQKFDQVSLPEAISSLVEEIQYLAFIEKNYDNAKQADRRKNDIMHFIESAERFVKYNDKHATLKNFVERLLLQDSQDQKEDDEDDDDIRKNEVTMMTMHSSKGLEFDKVYMVGTEEELLPSKKTISLGQDINEERRLCYVGITRAKEKLIMTYCKERKIYGKNMSRFKSRFLIDLEDFYIEQDRTTFGHMSEEEADQYKSNFFSGLLESLDA